MQLTRIHHNWFWYECVAVTRCWPCVDSPGRADIDTWHITCTPARRNFSQKQFITPLKVLRTAFYVFRQWCKTCKLWRVRYLLLFLIVCAFCVTEEKARASAEKSIGHMSVTCWLYDIIKCFIAPIQSNANLHVHVYTRLYSKTTYSFFTVLCCYEYRIFKLIGLCNIILIIYYCRISLRSFSRKILNVHWSYFDPLKIY